MIFGMKHHLVTSTKCVQIISLGPKVASPGCHMFYTGLYREKHEEILLSETIGLRALIFGMWHDQLDLYKVCSNHASGSKNDHTPGSHVLHSLI